MERIFFDLWTGKKLDKFLKPQQDARAQAKDSSADLEGRRRPLQPIYKRAYDRVHLVRMAKPGSGARITNSTGVPGTLGCLAYTLHDEQLVLLSTWHVLFGNGAREGDAVWLVNESDGERTYSPLGRSLYGKLGRVRFDGEEHYIDCAVSSYLTAPGDCFLDGHDSPRVGDLVTKTGAATGTTVGIIMAVNYSKPVGQILIKPIDNGAFAAEGDSGSIIMSDSKKALGLLWGTNTRGEGVACPIAPVLYAMNITLRR